MQQKKNMRRTVVWLIILVLVMVALMGGVYAKYITTRMERAEMLSSSFHFSSNYLEADTVPAYQVSDMQEISFELYNYEKTNVESISGEEITYRISTSSPWGVRITDSQGNEVEPQKKTGLYVLPASSEREQYFVTLYGGSHESVVVTAETVSPYKLELKAEFKPSSEPAAYQVEDKGNTCLLTVRSNDHSGPFTVSWDPRKVSPDNLNPLMQDWQDSNPNRVFTTEKNRVYELIFVKNKDVEIRDKNGTGISVTIE